MAGSESESTGFMSLNFLLLRGVFTGTAPAEVELKFWCSRTHASSIPSKHSIVEDVSQGLLRVHYSNHQVDDTLAFLSSTRAVFGRTLVRYEFWTLALG